MLWYLVIQVMLTTSINGAVGPTAPAQVGPFKSVAACEAAAAAIKKSMSGIRYACVADQ